MPKKPPNPDDPDSPFPKERESIRCSLCGHKNFRKCKCEWDKGFEHWDARYAPIIRELDWDEWGPPPK